MTMLMLMLSLTVAVAVIATVVVVAVDDWSWLGLFVQLLLAVLMHAFAVVVGSVQLSLGFEPKERRRGEPMG